MGVKGGVGNGGGKGRGWGARVLRDSTCKESKRANEAFLQFIAYLLTHFSMYKQVRLHPKKECVPSEDRVLV